MQFDLLSSDVYERIAVMSKENINSQLINT